MTNKRHDDFINIEEKSRDVGGGGATDQRWSATLLTETGTGPSENNTGTSISL